MRLLKSWQRRCTSTMRLALAGMVMLAGLDAFSQATVTTLTDANHGKAGYKDGNTFSAAQFRWPAGIALDPSGTTLFLADCTNNAVRLVNNLGNKSTSWTSSAYVGTNGISYPIAIAIDKSTNIFILNHGSGKNGSVLEFNAGYYINYGVKYLIATNASGLTNATSLALDGVGNIYVTVNSNTVIRIGGGTNMVVGVITNQFTSLRGVVVMDSGSLALTDAGNNGIWVMDPSNTNRSNNAVKFTGFNGAADVLGPPAVSAFNRPENIAKAGNGVLVVTDYNNNKVKVINTAGNVSRLYGVNSIYWANVPTLTTKGWNDGTVNPNETIDTVQARQPYGLAIASDSTVYVTETYYNLLREATGTGLPILPPPPPAAPSIYSITTNFGQVTLTWSAVSGATGYNVKRTTDTNSSAVFTTIATTTTNSYTDINVVGGITYYYVVSALNTGGESANSAEVSVMVPLLPVPDPEIGDVDFPSTSTPVAFTSVFHQVSPSSADFNNDAFLVIKGTPGTLTYYTIDGSTPSTTNGTSISSYYQDGLPTTNDLTTYEISPQVAPTLVVKAIGTKSDGSPNSAVVQAVFNFKTGNPSINGNNAAQFGISDITSGAQFAYTTDGSDPRTNANATFIGPTASTNIGLTLSLGFPANTNTMLFQIIAFKANYQTSSIVSQVFSISNYIANTISFGFANGEASSTFVGAPGQTFYAPVTLTTLPNTKMYSLQFSITVTNASITTNAGPAITPGAFGFQSMLMAPIPPPTNFPPGVNLFTPIPPYMFIANASSPPPTNQIVNYNNANFVDLEIVNTNLNLLGVGWLERYTQTNLYNTLSQTLITYSMTHDDIFPNSLQPNGVVVGGYGFTIPGTATNGQQYQIQISRASATDDGIGAPGSGVLIAAPTNGATAGGSPINALKYVTVGQKKYLVGDVYPFHWFNAGDFGYGDLTTWGSSDAEQVFQSAIYGFNTPPAASDFFDAMDSCGSIGVLDSDPNDANNGNYTNTFANLNTAQLNALFNGNDTNINQIAFGDGNLDVCDVYVTFRRSQDSSLTWYRRFWNGGQRVADTGIANHVVSKFVTKSSGTAQPKITIPTTVAPQVNFTAGDITNCSAGQVVSIPINATIYGSYPLRVLMLNLAVEPLDGSPALTTPVQFTQTAGILGTPFNTDTKGNNYAAVWLNSTNAGLTGTVTIGTLKVTIPAGASANAAYAVHFDHASASPNGLASFPKQTLTGLITLSSRTSSSYGDGIPDSWRLRWFGTANNYLSLSNACPSGDGINNWMKFVAGVDPNTANDFPSTNPVKPTPPGSTMSIHWPSVSGKQYVIERSSAVFSGNWTAISTNTGTGTDMEFDDNSASAANFYRVLIVP